jgi:hypothetical protein
MADDADEGPAYETVYETWYPAHGPIDADSTSVTAFRGLFLDRVAREVSRYFAAYPADERLDMK